MIQSLRTAIRRAGLRMDRATVGAYDAGAAAFAKDWHDQPAPVDLHALVKRFFRPGRSADIGCGSGREVAFLAANGFDAVGYDASDALLEQARLRYPRLTFATAALPALAGVPDAAFDNVLCETVIMHLRRPQILDAVRRLLAIAQARRNSLSELARHRWRRPARSAGPALLGLRERADPRGNRRPGRDAARRRARQRVFGQENPPHRRPEERRMTLSVAPRQR